jgi:hypothetical protein
MVVQFVWLDAKFLSEKFVWIVDGLAAAILSSVT